MAAAEARKLLEWDQTSELLACQMNIAAKKHVVTAAKINPMRQKQNKPKPLTLESLVDFVDI